MVDDVDDGTADGAQFFRDGFRFGYYAQFLGTDREREPVAGTDGAALGRRNEQAVSRRGLDLQVLVDATDDRSLDDVRRADEAGDEAGGGAFVDVFGKPDLFDLALAT